MGWLRGLIVFVFVVGNDQNAKRILLFRIDFVIAVVSHSFSNYVYYCILINIFVSYHLYHFMIEAVDMIGNHFVHGNVRFATSMLSLVGV